MIISLHSTNRAFSLSKLQSFRRLSFRLGYLFFIMACCVVSCFSSLNVAHAAVPSPEQTKLMQEGIRYFNVNPDSCNGSSDSSGGSAQLLSYNTDGPVWNSGLQPPYYLEVFVINVLKDLASKTKTPETNAVTQEHVVALVAWMWSEGGDIANNDIFNPLNTGINRPDLLATSNSGNGLQSFKSFDAGVEATTLTMAGSLQNRIAAALTDPNTTAEQVMDAITYYQRYPGNAAWAEADTANQVGYHNNLLQNVTQARSRYTTEAATVLGTPAKEELENVLVPASQLQYGPGGGNSLIDSGSTSNCSCNSGTTDTSGTATTAPTTNANAPTIVLDPGHAPSADIKIDPVTNLAVDDYENAGEMQQVWDISQQLTSDLQKAGYNVLNTKKSEADTSTDLKKRAEVGNQANAALGVSIHASPGGDSEDNVFVPLVGNWRLTATSKNVTTPYTAAASTTAPTGPGFQALSYTNTALAAADLKDGQLLADARSKAEDGVNVKVGGYSALVNSYLNRSEPGVYTMNGTMTTTQYFATIPWLYNEQYEDAGNGLMTTATMQKYETGLLNGIEAIVPVNGGGSSTASTGTCASNGVVAGSVVQTALGLAWPTPASAANPPHSPGTPTPAYVAALAKYNPTVGAGEDCGQFVSTVMRASGADPGYPVSGTNLQAAWILQHSDKYTTIFPATSTVQLQPGDILLLNGRTTIDAAGVIHPGDGSGANGHTYIYVGPQAGGYNEASASLNERMPNLDFASITDGRGQYMIARLK